MRELAARPPDTRASRPERLTGVEPPRAEPRRATDNRRPPGTRRSPVVLRGRSRLRAPSRRASTLPPHTACRRAPAKPAHRPGAGWLRRCARHRRPGQIGARASGERWYRPRQAAIRRPGNRWRVRCMRQRRGAAEAPPGRSAIRSPQPRRRHGAARVLDGCSQAPTTRRAHPRLVPTRAPPRRETAP